MSRKFLRDDELLNYFENLSDDLEEDENDDADAPVITQSSNSEESDSDYIADSNFDSETSDDSSVRSFIGSCSPFTHDEDNENQQANQENNNDVSSPAVFSHPNPQPDVLRLRGPLVRGCRRVGRNIRGSVRIRGARARNCSVRVQKNAERNAAILRILENNGWYPVMKPRKFQYRAPSKIRVTPERNEPICFWHLLVSQEIIVRIVLSTNQHAVGSAGKAAHKEKKSIERLDTYNRR